MDSLSEQPHTCYILEHPLRIQPVGGGGGGGVVCVCVCIVCTSVPHCISSETTTLQLWEAKWLVV